VGSWFKWAGPSAVTMLKIDPSSDTGELLMQSGTGTKAGRVWRLDYSENDHLDLIPWRWTSPVHDFGEPESVKMIRQFGLDASDFAGGITVEWIVDHGAASGTFEAQKKGKYWWTTNAMNHWRFNNSSSDQLRGLYWEPRKQGEVIYNLPPTALGRRVQVVLSGTSGLPPSVINYSFIWDRRNFLYPSTESYQRT